MRQQLRPFRKDRNLDLVPLQSRREQTIAALCEHFSNDCLTVAEFEQRLDAAHTVQTMSELDGLLQDLPALAAPLATHTTVGSAASARVTEHARAQQHFVAIMGGVDRKGAWQPARRTFCYALMGGAALDFREALLPPGETEVTIIALMGGAEIIVPPGLRIDCHGIAIMGGFDHGEEVASGNRNAPVLKINGLAMMGGVHVQVRARGESAKDAKLRRRAERRRRRDEWRDK